MAVAIDENLTKQLNGWEMPKRIKTNCKVYVQTFSVGTTTCMGDYMKSALQMSSDYFILHIGTNDSGPSKSTKEMEIQ